MIICNNDNDNNNDKDKDNDKDNNNNIDNYKDNDGDDDDDDDDNINMLEGITSFCGVANLWMVELIRTQLRKLEPDPSETITTKLRAGAARISLRNIVISQKSTFKVSGWTTSCWKV